MIRFLDAAGLPRPIYAVEIDGRVYGVEDVALLLELYEDVARWRESGDARDLAYVIETVDEIEEGAGHAD
jgi:hypothetical protein